MNILDITKETAYAYFVARAIEELDEVDTDALYDQMLDEVLEVPEWLSHKSAAKLLEDNDPIAYRCGYSDFLDSQDVTDIGTGTEAYYNDDDLEELRETILEEIKIAAEEQSPDDDAELHTAYLAIEALAY